jgi:hypothetical protein
MWLRITVKEGTLRSVQKPAVGGGGFLAEGAFLRKKASGLSCQLRRRWLKSCSIPGRDNQAPSGVGCRAFQRAGIGVWQGRTEP